MPTITLTDEDTAAMLALLEAEHDDYLQRLRDPQPPTSSAEDRSALVSDKHLSERLRDLLTAPPTHPDLGTDLPEVEMPADHLDAARAILADRAHASVGCDSRGRTGRWQVDFLRGGPDDDGPDELLVLVPDDGTMVPVHSPMLRECLRDALAQSAYALQYATEVGPRGDEHDLELAQLVADVRAAEAALAWLRRAVAHARTEDTA